MIPGEPHATAPPGVAWPRLAVVGVTCAAAAGAVLSLARYRSATSPGDLLPFAATVCLPLAIILAGGIVCAAWPSSWRRSAGWLALALLGQAAALQLTEAGTGVRYQRFHPWGAALSSSPLAAGMLAIHTLVVCAALRGRALTGVRRLRELLPGWRLPAFALACFVAGAAPAREHAAYLAELCAVAGVQLVQLATLVLAAACAPPAAIERAARLADRVLGPRETDPSTPPGNHFGRLVAVAVFVVTAVLSLLVYQLHPHVQDEVKYLLHARYLAAGSLGFPMPPVPDGFELFLMEGGPHGWYAVTPPGWPALLAVGVRVGLPWLVNPALAALDVLLFHALMRRLYPERTARLATLLLAASPWYLFLGMSLMSHHLTLAGALVGALGVDAARRSGRVRGAAAGGLGIGVVVATRQLDGLIAAALAGLWALGLGGKRIPLRAMVALALGCAAVVGVLLLYNRLYTGDPLSFPIMAHIDRLFGPGANAYGFGPDRGMGWPLDPNPGHGPVDGTINGLLNLSATNVELFGWGSGCIWPALLLVLRGRLQRADRVMLSVVVLTFVAYFFNYYSGGPDFGARYWFLMIVPGAALTARAIVSVGEALEHGEPPVGDGRTRLLLVAFGLTAVATCAFLPWRSLDRYKGFRGMAPRLAPLTAGRVQPPALVLVRGKEVPDWMEAALLNPFDVNTGGVVYAWDRNPEVRRELLGAYSDRAVWFVDGPSRTGAGYALVAGPMSVPEAGRRPFEE